MLNPLVSAFYALRAKRRPNRILFLWLFLLLATLGFATSSTDSASFFSSLVYPATRFFRFPFKWYFLVQFFFVLFIATVLNRFRIWHRKIIFLPILVTSALLCPYMALSRTLDYFPGLVPLAEIDSDRRSILQEGRLFTVDWPMARGYGSEMLIGNIPSYYHLQSIGGLDPLLSEAHRRIASSPEMLKAYGVVNYLMLQRFEDDLHFCSMRNLRISYTNKAILICKDRLSSPIVCADKGEALKYELSGNEVQIDASRVGAYSPITAAFHYSDNWVATSEDSQANIRVDKDLFNRIVITSSRAVGTITLRYKDRALREGLLLSFLAIILFFPVRALIAVVFCRRGA